MSQDTLSNNICGSSLCCVMHTLYDILKHDCECSIEGLENYNSGLMVSCKEIARHHLPVLQSIYHEDGTYVLRPER